MTVHLPEPNRRWSLADMAEIERMIRRHDDAATIAEAMLTTPDEIREVARRNGYPVPK